MVQQTAYGNDEYTNQAKSLISRHLKQDDTDIHFVAGGTLANIICIASMLKHYEDIISASSGHIALREAGAIEETGHKMISVASKYGKLTCKGIKDVLKNNSHAPHMAKPKLVYISNITEMGTVYIKAELQEILRFVR